MSEIRIGIVGCGGRMGQALVREVLDSEQASLSGGTERHDSPLIGSPIRHPASGEDTGLKISDNAENLFKISDIVIDFTCPTATRLHCSYAEKYDTAHIVGTTGMTEEDERAVNTAAEFVPVIYASNFSLGVNLLFYLTRQAAHMLDEDFDIEILEMHHRHKVDAPSGTALSLGRAAAQGRGVNLDDVADKVRDGITGERRRGDIGFAVLRGGNVAGEHTVSFNAYDERVELTHKATDRAIFARGALKAALWAFGRQAGLYDMFDVLGLDKG
ncbi:4-hydroxy-tetrahydrodipicolinate reductase [Emcibacter nanhaiensis]|uniref:4-hydroxy-tetrahydrodipicolinate reductase n=1 Tax=Emcibacter nanhaiensis TaxID=1505037 RepID=UPI001C6155C8|nr:4-hydroxy-tetrahydrodipicolinate reductase [Emcibacter nanhaiensis]